MVSNKTYAKQGRVVELPRKGAVFDERRSYFHFYITSEWSHMLLEMREVTICSDFGI